MRSLNQKKPIRSQMVGRSWFIVASMIVLGSVIIGRVVYLQTVKKDSLIKSMENIKSKEMTVPASRGNILASDGIGLLATTVPRFEVAIDPSKKANPKDTITIKRKGKPDSLVLYSQQVDKLCGLLANNFKDRTKEEYRQLISSYRKKNKEYVRLIPRLVSVEESMLIATFPFFKDNSRLNGGILKRHYIREYPFGRTARRTIGSVNDEEIMKGIHGIEFSFNTVLAGSNGYGFYDKISGGNWRATEARNEVQPEAGKDIVTTLDVNFQDIAETALLKKLIESNAKYGSVMVMEVKTGEIKAIANFGRVSGKEGEKHYVDNDNYAVKEKTDPGSTFKLVSMLALLEKANLSPDNFAVTCQGRIRHTNGKILNCSHTHGSLTVKQVFEQSCNVGIYQLMKTHFGFKKSSDFYDYITKFKINEPTEFQLIGSAKPDIVFPGDKKRFSSTTIPWTSIGYEMGLTPLHTLIFYNTIANNGYRVEPIIVKEVREANKTKEVFSAKISSSPICSAKSIRLIKEMLEGVVIHGSAEAINKGYCRVAGKTGTAQKLAGGYRNGTEVYTSFAGYFPAENPKYSCIVVVDEPKNGILYGSSMAAPVFREIADKVFAYDITIHPTKKIQPSPNQLAQRLISGRTTDFVALKEGFSIKNITIDDKNNNWLMSEKNHTSFRPINTSGKSISVEGMVLRDALQVLENAGFVVSYSGTGKVSRYELSSPNQVALFLQ